jgi:tRNA dimethylallyltransferase
VSEPIVAIVGPTGVGKSDLAIQVCLTLAERGVSAEIINADAMQLYAGMDIGTAKVSESERQGVVHHLLDVWPVSKEASVADYQALARGVIADCHSRGVVPLLVGGSGLYVSSVLYEFEFPGTNPTVREALEKRLQEEGVEVLVAELQEKDPEAAEAIDPRNSRRIVRALEVIEITGKPFGAGLHARSTLWREPVLVVGLQRERPALSRALEQRVEKMWGSGLVAEVRALMDGPEPLGVTASQAIGYRQVMEHLAGSSTQSAAIAETVSLTKRYARRQMSWFRRDPQIVWRGVDDPGAVEAITDEVVEWTVANVSAH